MLDEEERLLIEQGKAPLEQGLQIDVSDDDGDIEEEEEEGDIDVSDVDSVISRQSGFVDRTAIVENHDFVRF